MIYKYLNGSRGITRGSKGGAGNGSSGGDPQPYNLSALSDPFFITNEYLQTVAGTNKQLQGMRDMLHSLPAPSSAPEIFIPASNYNAIDQQYIDAESKLKNTPILGTSINQHIAQQQALGERGVALDHQKIQNFSQMLDADLAKQVENDYQNALSRHKTAEDRRVFDMGVKQQIQDNEDAAIAIKTDAAKKVGQEFYSLHKMQEMRNNAKAMAQMQRKYLKDRQSAVDEAKEEYYNNLDLEYWNQFKKDYESPDVETIIEKYGIDPDDFDQDFDKIIASDEYQAKLQEYKDSKIEDWTKLYNKTLLQFDDDWWNANEDEYYSYKFKSGGKVETKIKDTPKDRILERLSRKNEKIAVDNNRALREFVEQMNEKQAKIFLKLMSI